LSEDDVDDLLTTEVALAAEELLRTGIVEIGVLDTLSLENSIARSRTPAYLAMAAIKLLEVGELEQRIAVLEGAVHSQNGLPESEFDREPKETQFSVEVDP